MSSTAQRLAIKAAAQWHARLGAAPHCSETLLQWQQWRQQDELHRWAWQRVEALQSQLQTLPGSLAYRTLSTPTPPQLGRRTLLKGLVLGAGVGGLAWLGDRQAPLWLADLRTATGQRRSLNLEDGTRLTLNTASAVDVLFDEQQRLIVLRAGEILVETAKDSRPLLVRSAQGQMRALGTRFTVRLDDERTELTVLEHAVAVRNSAAQQEVRVEAGQMLRFDQGPLPAPQPADPNQAQWSQGRLVIDDWRLDRLLAELGRYRPGVLECAPEVAHLRLSGAYPLDDTDRALAAITRALPVRLQSRTRYWVRLLPQV
ncbi:FecR domain-containing protein [Aquipseudomonas alcaligenes]|uniref:FecR domain-containing protein n=1 Tax=Aquipseudomonas alcaligenes TaxID=43263 RepID=UPI00374796C8